MMVLEDSSELSLSYQFWLLSESLIHTWIYKKKICPPPHCSFERRKEKLSSKGNGNTSYFKTRKHRLHLGSTVTTWTHDLLWVMWFRSPCDLARRLWPNPRLISQSDFWSPMTQNYPWVATLWGERTEQLFEKRNLTDKVTTQCLSMISHTTFENEFPLRNHTSLLIA